MGNKMKFLIATFVFYLLVMYAESWNDGGNVLLREIQVITLYKGRHTNSRRTSPVPQLQCTGGSAGCLAFVPEVVQCQNKGWDGFDVQWECKTDMDNAYRFGTIEVSCEGYNYPDDPYVLKGSCGLEYTLELTEHGTQSRKSSYGSGGFGSGYFQGSSSNINSQTSGDASSLIVVAVLLLFAYGVYKMFLCGPLQGQQRFPNDDYPNTHTHDYQSGTHTMGPPPPGFKPDYMGNTGDRSNAGYTGASAGFGSTSDGYGFGNNFARPHGTDNSRPGFWTGMGTGGVLGYLFGSQRSHTNTGTRNTWNSTSFPTKPAGNTGTRTASGFGGTKRR
ncbi:store-operated calcium entry-associated regulatory factor [Polyodon spathula]|uniref:store-operated calcium entry-associated regulatory factor n=1 Tax=Polyodon spathula TaxID=7913 RepID=UPI001B7E19F4|nr:store-operated calcium entry-associated regulatory factor [Polyodon spathula]